MSKNTTPIPQNPAPSNEGSACWPDALLHGGANILQSMADALPAIMWTAAPDGNHDFFNQSWLDYTGLGLDQSLESGWEKAVHPDDRPESRAAWLLALRTGTDLETEYRLLRQDDNSYRWHTVRSRPLRDERGALIKWMGMCVDIEDHKRAQNTLRDTMTDIEKRFKEQTSHLRIANMELLDAINDRRRAAAIVAEDMVRLTEIITTQAFLAQADLDLPAFLKLSAEKAEKLTPATGATVELIEGDSAVCRAASGNMVQYLGMSLKLSHSLSGVCIKTRQVVRCVDARDDPRVDHAMAEKVSAVAMVVAPLYRDGAVIGVLKVTSEVPGAFGDNDMQTVTLMAGLLGAAITQQTRYDANQQLLAERTRALSSLHAEMEQRLRSEEQLRQREQFTGLVLESSHDAFVSMDAAGVIVDWNRQAETMFGWSKQEAVGQDLADLLIPEMKRARHRAGIHGFAQTGKASVLNQVVEVVGLHRSGRQIPIELSISAIADGTTYIANAFARDISERKKTEKHALEREKFLRTITDHLPAWIAYIDRDERYRFANAYYEKESGLPPGAIIGRTIKEVLGEEIYAGIRTEIAQVLGGEEIRSERVPHSSRDQRRKYAHYVPDFAEDGSVAGFYLMCSNRDLI